MEKLKRVNWLDVARSLAIISITCNHAVSRSFSTEIGQYAEFVAIPFLYTVLKAVIYAFSRLGVPLFLMITGALMLNKDYEKEGAVTRFLKHNWLQLLITAEIWLVIMYIYMQVSSESLLRTQGILACLKGLVQTMLFIDPISFGSMWYMYMILCTYLMIPIFAIALKRIKHSYFIIPIVIIIFSSFILPDVNGILRVSGNFNIIHSSLSSANLFSMFAVFMLLGYFISNNNILARVKTPLLVLLLAVSFAAFCAFQIWCYSKQYDFTVADHYDSILCLIPSALLFELLRRLKYGERLSKAAAGLSRISFGIYFVHICIMQGLSEVLGKVLPKLTYFPKFLLLELVSVGASIIIILVLSKIKWFKKNLFVIK